METERRICAENVLLAAAPTRGGSRSPGELLRIVHHYRIRLAADRVRSGGEVLARGEKNGEKGRP